MRYLLLMLIALTLVVGCGKKNTKKQTHYQDSPGYNHYTNDYYNDDYWYNPYNDYAGQPCPASSCGYYQPGNLYCGGSVGGWNPQNFFNSCFSGGNAPGVYLNGQVYNPYYYNNMINNAYANSGSGNFQNWYCGSPYAGSQFYYGNGGTAGSFCGNNGIFNNGLNYYNNNFGGSCSGGCGVTFSW